MLVQAYLFVFGFKHKSIHCSVKIKALYYATWSCPFKRMLYFKKTYIDYTKNRLTAKLSIQYTLLDSQI